MRLRVISLSVLLHIFIILLISFGAGWLWVKKDKTPPAPIVKVEILKIADKTKTNKKTKPKKTSPKPKEKKKIVKKQKPAPKKPPKAATNKAEQKPVHTVKAPPKISNKKTEDIKKISKPPVKKPKNKKPKTKTTEKDFSSVLKNLAEGQKKTEKHEVKKEVNKQEIKEDTKKSFLEKINLDDDKKDTSNLELGKELTISEIEALRRQLSTCWSIPIGAKNIEKLKVKIYMEVNPDRTVKTAKIVDMGLHTDDAARVAAISALRAVLDPQCSPLELPRDKYLLWREIIVEFDPQNMF